MKYTFTEYKKLREEHDKEMNCLDWIDCYDFPSLYNSVCKQWKENPNGYSVTLTRPVNTLDTFKADMEFWNWIKQTFPDPKQRPPVGWWPTFGWWSFHKSYKDLFEFNNKNEWKDDIIYNIKTIDLWTGGAEITLLNDEKKYIIFDEIEFNK